MNGIALVRLSLLALVLAVLIAPATDAEADASTQEHLFIFLDVSGSMKGLVPGPSAQTRFDEAATSALELAFQELYAGKAVRIIPFAAGPTDGNGLLAVRKVGETLAKTYREVEAYVWGARPPKKLEDTKEHRKYKSTIIWGTVKAFHKLLAASGRNTTIAIFTDGADTTNSSKQKEAEVRAELRKAWRLDAQAKISIYAWIWSPVSLSVPAPNASLAVTDRQEIQVKLSEFSGGATARREVRVRAIISKSASPSDGFSALRVDVTPLSPNAPPLQVSGTLASRLTRGSPDGTVSLGLHGDFPAGKIEKLYELRLLFSFRTDLKGVRSEDRQREIPAGSALRVRVSSNPSHALQVLEHQRLELYPGQVKSFECEVRGNEDAQGTACVLSTLHPRGAVEVGLSPSEAALPQGKIGSSELSVVLQEKSTRVRVSVRGVGRGEGEVLILALSGGRTVRGGVSVSVSQPRLLPGLMRSGEATELPEGPEARTWQPLSSGPLRLGVEGDLTNVKARVEVTGNASDVEVGLGSSMESAIVVDLGDPQARMIPLHARWRSETPPRDFTTPSLRVSIEGNPPFSVEVEPSTVPLLVIGPAASLTVQGAEPGFVFEQRGDQRVLVLPTKRVRVGEPASWECVLAWNAGAAGKDVAVAVEAPQGMTAEAIPVVSGESLTQATPGAWKLSSSTGGSARVTVRTTSPSSSGSYVVSSSFGLADSEVPSARIEAPLEVGPVLVPVKVQTGEAAAVARGIPLQIAQVEVEGGAAPGATVSARLLFDEEGVKAELAFESSGSAHVAVPSGGILRDSLRATLRADPERELGKLEGRLILRPEWAGGDVSLVDEAGAELQELTVPLSVEVKVLGVGALYNSESCMRVPPTGHVKITGPDREVHRTSTYRRPFTIVLTGGLPLPPQHEAAQLKVVVTDGAQLLGAVAFEVEDEPEPVAAVALGDLPRVKGLVFRSLPNLQESAGEQFAAAHIELRAEELGLSQKLEVPLHRAGGVPWMWIGIAVVVAVIVWLVVRNLRQDNDIEV